MCFPCRNIFLARGHGRNLKRQPLCMVTLGTALGHVLGPEHSFGQEVADSSFDSAKMVGEEDSANPGFWCRLEHTADGVRPVVLPRLF